MLSLARSRQQIVVGPHLGVALDIPGEILHLVHTEPEQLVRYKVYHWADVLWQEQLVVEPDARFRADKTQQTGKDEHEPILRLCLAPHVLDSPGAVPLDRGNGIAVAAFVLAAVGYECAHCYLFLSLAKEARHALAAGRSCCR